MPEVAERSIADRSRGARVNTHPRLNGDEILQPDDVLEGKGDLVTLKADGSPEFCDLGRVPVADGRMAAIGTTPDSITIQNTHPVPVSRASFTASGPLIRGAALPNASTPGLAKIPKPAPPTIKKIPATDAGYAAYTATSPGFYFYTFVNLTTGAETLPSPPSPPFRGGYGQSYRVTLPQNVPPGFGVGLYLPEPGTSRPVAPGTMWRQRVVDPTQHVLPHYDLTGPFRHERQAPTANETAVGALPAPYVGLLPGYEIAKHHYRFLVTEVDAFGNESIAGVLSNEIYIPGYAVGKHLEVYRPPLSPGAKGWYLYCLIWDDPTLTDSSGGSPQWNTLASQYYKAYYRSTRVGADVPLPAWLPSMSVVGQVTEGLSAFPFDLSQAAPPRQDSTLVAAPTSAPEIPASIGAARPAPGRYYAAQVDSDGEALSLPSDPVAYDLGDNEIARIVFSNPTSKVPNGTYLEMGPSGLPLDHTVDRTNIAARMEAGNLVLETPSAQTGATGSTMNDPVPVNPTQEGSLSALFSVENPPNGNFAGSVQLVFRETNASAAATDTVLLNATSPGEYDYYQPVDKAGTANSPLAYRSDTVQAQLMLRHAGATKNARIRSRRVRIKDHKHRGVNKPPSSPSPSAPPPNAPLPASPPGSSGPAPPPAPPGPGSATTLSPPSRPPEGPDTYPISAPNRPLSSGEVLNLSTFESGIDLIWSQHGSGGGQVSASPAAALSGSGGLRLSKSAGGSLATAYLSQNLPESPFIGGGKRYDSGLYSKTRVASFVGTGAARIRELARPSDGAAFAWTEVSRQAEVAQLALTDQPVAAGNVSVSLDGVVTSVPVNAVSEVATLTVNTPPTTPGTTTITLDGVPYHVPVGGLQEAATLGILGGATTPGYILIVLDNVPYYIPVSTSTGYGRPSLIAGNPLALAQQIASYPFPGWYVWVASYSPGGTTATVAFTSVLPGPRADIGFSPLNTGVNAYTTITQQGTAESATDFANRVRSTSFPGWTTGGSGNQVTFTANASGPRQDATFSADNTGVGASMVTTTQGSVDSLATLASRIRGTSFPGWSMGGSGNQVTFTATASGRRQDASYDPGNTGARGQMSTLTQGSNLDVTAFVSDDFGLVRSKKIMADLTSATVFNVDLTVSGAGTEHAVVDVWGSVGSGALQLLAHFEGVSLANYPAGLVRAGVTSETSPSLTWEIHMDDVTVTDRGKNYYRQHNARGEWFPVLAYYGVPGQPVLQRVPVKNGLIPVLPGLSYDLAAFVSYDGVPSGMPARPLYVTALLSDGSERPLGDITGPNGLTGSAGWREYAFPGGVTVPDGCYFLRIDSRDVSVGTILVQEIVAPLSGGARRTYRYATAGSYTSTLYLGTPNEMGGAMWGRTRTLLDAAVDTLPGGSAALAYRSADPLPGPQPATGPIPQGWTAFVPDPDAVPQKDFVQVKAALSGGGISSPVLRAGSPMARYELLLPARGKFLALLKPDGSEFSGGAAFSSLPEWSAKPVGVGRAVLPSGQPYDYPDLFDPVGTIAAGAELIVFSLEAKRWLEEHWKSVLGIEAFGELLTVKLSAPILFERDAPGWKQDGGRYGIYKAKLGMMWVLAATPLETKSPA